MEKEGSETVFPSRCTSWDGRQDTSWLLSRAAWPVPLGTILCDSPSRTRLRLFTLLHREPCRLRSLCWVLLLSLRHRPACGGSRSCCAWASPRWSAQQFPPGPKPGGPSPDTTQGPCLYLLAPRSPGKCTSSCQRLGLSDFTSQYAQAVWVSTGSGQRLRLAAASRGEGRRLPGRSSSSMYPLLFFRVDLWNASNLKFGDEFLGELRIPLKVLRQSSSYEAW